jgi:hypothetical protein
VLYQVVVFGVYPALVGAAGTVAIVQFAFLTQVVEPGIAVPPVLPFPSYATV